MAVYGPVTGNYSSQSIKTARKTGGSGGSKLTNNNGSWNYTPDSSGLESQYEQQYYNSNSGSGYGSTSGYGSSGSSGNSYYNSWQSLLDKQLQAQQDAINKQTQATIDSINLYRPKVTQDYEKQQQENYISNTKNQYQIGDYMNAMGYSGGLAESTLANLNTNYQNNRAAADKERNNAMLALDQQVAQARSTGDASLADAANTYYTNYLNALQQQEQFDYQKQIQAQNDYANTIGAHSNNYQAEINKLLSSGVSEDDYRIKYLNAARNDKITNQQAAAAAAAQQEFLNNIKLQQLNNQTAQTNYNISKPIKTSSGGSSGLTSSNARYLYENGYITEEQMLKALGL